MLAIHQRHERRLHLQLQLLETRTVPAAVVMVGRQRRYSRRGVRLDRYQRREVTPGVTEGDRRTNAERGLPQKRQVDALESRVACKQHSEA